MKGVKLQENPEVKGNELISLEKKVIIIISCTSFDDYHDEREFSLLPCSLYFLFIANRTAIKEENYEDENFSCFSCSRPC